MVMSCNSSQHKCPSAQDGSKSQEEKVQAAETSSQGLAGVGCLKLVFNTVSEECPLLQQGLRMQPSTLLLDDCHFFERRLMV